MTISAEWYEEQRAVLQRILEQPTTECEKAFREIELSGKSQPKEWHAELCGMHALMWRMFQYGWKAKGAEGHCKQGENCCCWGDTERVRRSCASWAESNYGGIRATE